MCDVKWLCLCFLPCWSDPWRVLSPFCTSDNNCHAFYDIILWLWFCMPDSLSPWRLLITSERQILWGNEEINKGTLGCCRKNRQIERRDFIVFCQHCEKWQVLGWSASKVTGGGFAQLFHIYSARIRGGTLGGIVSLRLQQIPSQNLSVSFLITSIQLTSAHLDGFHCGEKTPLLLYEKLDFWQL